MPKPKILFFDVGNVFVSDDPSACYCYRELHQTLDNSSKPVPAEFFKMREERMRRGGDLWSFVKDNLPAPDFQKFRNRVRAELFSNWPELSPEIPGMAAAARELAKHYRLGVIANQPREVRPLLKERGLLDLFEVLAISEELGWNKPDPRIFHWAFEKAGVSPGEAMMIGDRIDNDIRPARALGMQTLWLRLNFAARAWPPSDAFEHCYAESLNVINIREFLPKSPDEQPDYEASSPEELVKVLLRY